MTRKIVFAALLSTLAVSGLAIGGDRSASITPDCATASSCPLPCDPCPLPCTEEEAAACAAQGCDVEVASCEVASAQ